MDFGLKGKKALVTGASRGLGAEVAKMLAQEGVSVGLIARDEDKLKEVVDGLEGKGHGYFAADLMKPKELDKAVSELEKQVGEFDILINNVGGALGRYSVLSDKKDWFEMIDYNVGIAMDINNKLIPKMQAKGWGRVVHTSSVSGKHLRGNPAYCLAKSALTDYTKILGREVAKDGVVVSSVSPGAFAFPGSYWDQVSKDDPARLKDFLEHYQVIGRLGKVEEVAAAVVFLASEHASFMAGADVPIDGGSL